MSIMPEQCRMARAGLKWSAAELAERAGVRTMTVSSFERGGDAYASTVRKLQDALETAGVVFVGTGEASLSGGAGVRLNGGVAGAERGTAIGE